MGMRDKEYNVLPPPGTAYQQGLPLQTKMFKDGNLWQLILVSEISLGWQFFISKPHQEKIALKYSLS